MEHPRDFDKSFLEDEIRLGFYIPAEIKQAWAAELEVLGVLDDICKKTGIEYFAGWGTLLGAVRHHGFIPWDDDIDVVMRREDYDIFLNKAPALLPEGFSIHTFRNEEDFREFHAVLVNSEHACFDKSHFDRFHGFCYTCGIDIFILDHVYPSEEKEDKRIKEALYLIALADSILDEKISPSDLPSNLSKVEEITKVSLQNIRDKKELWIKLYELADSKCAEVPANDSDFLTQMVPWGLKKLLPARYLKTDYEKHILMPFENTAIPVHLSYDKFLSTSYGYYHRFSKSGSLHGYPFYEKQKTALEELLGSKMMEYVFDHKSLEKNPSEDNFKELLKEGIEQLSDINSRICLCIENNSFDSDIFKEDVCSAQELAIDIGNMIENVKGEDHPSISYINTYCEMLYYMFEGSNEYNSSFKPSFDAMIQIITNDILNKKSIVFLPFKASAWDSFKDVYTAVSENPDFEVFVVPIPYYYKEYDGSLSNEQYDIDSYPKNIKIIPYNDFPLEFLHPDIIFIQNPYDEYNASTSVHPDFYSSKIRNYTEELIYIPWFGSCEINDGEERSYKNLKYYVTVPGIVNSDFTLLESSQEQKMYIKKLEEWSQENIWSSKILLKKDYALSKFGISLKSDKNDPSQISVLYYLGAGPSLDHADVFISRLKENIRMFKNKEDKLKLTLVTDHNLFDTIEKYAPDLVPEYQKILADLSSDEHVAVLSDSEPLESLVTCSAYYGDTSFISCEYIISNKPVMIQNYI